MGDVVKDELKKAPAPAFTFDVDMLTYADFKAIQTANMGGMYDLIEKCITGWNFAVPFEKGALRKLKLTESAPIFKAVMDAINEDVSDLQKAIKVNFDLGDGWTMDTMEKMEELSARGKHDQVAELLLDICRFASVKQPSVKSLTAAQGQAAYNAVIAKWTDVLTGKN